MSQFVFRKAAAKAATGYSADKETQAFVRAAGMYVKKATVSAKSARATLVSVGIFDRSGKLSANYK